MRSVALWKVIVILLAIVLSFYFLYPTMRLSGMSPEARAAMDPDKLAKLQDRAMKLGLDLRGGTYILLEVDKKGLSDEEARDAVDRGLEIIRNRIDQFGVSEPSIQRQGADRILVQLPGLQDVDRAKKLIGQTALLEFRLVEEGLPELLKVLDARVPASVRMELSRDLAREMEGEETGRKVPAAPESSATPGLTAPADTGQPILPRPDLEGAAEEQVVALPDLVSFTGRRADEPGIVKEEDVPLVEKLLGAAEVQASVPGDREIAWGSVFEQGREGRFKFLYLLRKKADVTGAKVSNASVRPDGDAPGTYEVSVKFTRTGSRAFYRMTRKNVGRLAAIVLDGKVTSAPEIRSAIPGVASITGGFAIEEARDLSIVLRAGRLPAPLVVIEERTVGPSLGQDSIRMGVRASLFGCLAVIIFMLVYYRLSGGLAILALAMNVLILTAVMALIGSTLTLPGIAGIALTVGMAVDANVLIYERIREELRKQKPVRAAIEVGYERATVTILDANITTIISAVVLLYFGTASVKGFAVTLTIGLIVNMFTAITMTRVVFDWITARWKVQRLSI